MALGLLAALFNFALAGLAKRRRFLLEPGGQHAILLVGGAHAWFEIGAFASCQRGVH